MWVRSLNEICLARHDEELDKHQFPLFGFGILGGIVSCERQPEVEQFVS